MITRSAIVAASIGLACVVIHGFPAVHPWLWYEPVAIGNGEWWRLLTCHLVHFSTSHLVLNVAAFVVLSLLLAKQASALTAFALCKGAVLISLGLLILCPRMVCFAGLSGICSMMAWNFALGGLLVRDKHRRLYGCVTVVLLLKLIFECVSGRSIALNDNSDVIIEPMAHLLGALCAVGWNGGFMLLRR